MKRWAVQEKRGGGAVVRVLIDSPCVICHFDTKRYDRVLAPVAVSVDGTCRREYARRCEAARERAQAQSTARSLRVLKAIESVGVDDVVLILTTPATIGEGRDDLAVDLSYQHPGRVRIVDAGARPEANVEVVLAAASAARAGATVDDVVAAAEAVGDDVRLIAALDVPRNWNDDGAVGLRGWYY